MIDQLKSTSAQCGIDFEKILNDARHVTLETDGIVKAMKMSSSSLQMLLEAIEAAKPLVQGGGDQT